MFQKVISFIILILLTTSCNQEESQKSNEKSSINSLKEVHDLFKDPPNQFRSAPLWVWNDLITKDQIDQQLNDFKTAGIGGVFIHPRPGLITEYLSDEWFSLCNYTVQKGIEIGLDVWLYDENSYPSGFAGGHVPAEMPESYNKGGGLKLEIFKKLPENADSFFLILKKQGQNFIDITDKLDEEKNKEGDYYLYTKKYYEKLGWHGGFSYVDLLHEGVTEKFIELTMTGYKNAFGKEFGKTVPGIFTDEPNIVSPGGLRWTPLLFKEFENRWGYDLKVNLPSLDHEIGDWKKIRHNYYDTLLELFIERWSKPWNAYTEENDLNWTGHYWEHGWPNPSHGADNMAMYAWHQMPAIDILMNEYSEYVNAQFGNVRSVKELSSVANQMGKTRTLSETYGAAGWDLRFEDMKRIGDWEYVLGVNFLNQHLSFVTIEGARKRDHPQSFSYHEPWWKNYKVQTDYFARLTLALSSGKQINNILIIEPTTTAWMYFSDNVSNNKFASIGPDFQKFVLTLEKYQIEYDLASENIMKDIAKVKNEKFVVGERSYDIIVIPPTLENLDKATFELVKTYLKNGGKVVSFNGIPDHVDGKTNNELKSIVEKNPKQWIETNAISDLQSYNLKASKSIRFQQPEMISGKLFHHRREFEDGQLLFLVNTSLEKWSKGTFSIKGKSVKEFDLSNGDVNPYPNKTNGNSMEIEFDLPPAGSLLLTISDSPAKEIPVQITGKARLINSFDKLRIEKKEPNVLTLDYCDLKLDGKIDKDIYFFNAADKVFKHYGFDGDPWNSAVQYKTSIIDKNNFSNRSGFEVSYPFMVDESVDVTSMQVVVEQPNLWQVLINGKKVTALPSIYWLDRKFTVYNIGKYVVKGENKITLNVSKMTVFTEIESVYILGDFSLKPQKKGWKLVPSKLLDLGSWKDQGFPFYSNNVSYTRTYSIKNKVKDKRYIIKLIDWNGSVAEILINNKPSGIIFSSPYELDITDKVTEGENEISVVVSGTLKNLLGPHHFGNDRGSVRPASFANASAHIPSGNQYDFIDYGLFQDFLFIESEGSPKKVYWKTEHVSKPVFKTKDSISVEKPILVSITNQTDGAEMRYTLDGSDPNRSSKLYVKPITLKKSVIVKVRAFKNRFISSPIVQHKYFVIKKKQKVSKDHKYQNGLEYSYYEGIWSKIPEFELLTAIRKDKIDDFNLDNLERRFANFAMEFTGYIKIDQSGIYDFYVNSNDGSILYIDDILIVNNDGVHGSTERKGKLKLDAGLHSIKLHYFDGGGSQTLEINYKGPGISRQKIPIEKLFY